MIDIRPDPQRPRGGYAQISVDGVTSTDAASEVAVFDSYQEKWLGPGGWQPGRASVPVRRAELDGTTLRVIVGPDVVNAIENPMVRIEIAGGSWDTYWPEDINHGPEIALEGDLGSTGSLPEPEAPRVAKKPVEKPAPEPEPEVSEEPGAIEPERPEDEQEGAGNKGLIPAIAAAILLAVIAGGAWFYLNGQEEEVPVAVVEPEPEPAPEPAPQPVIATGPACAPADFAGLTGGFSAVLDKMRGCVGTLSADAALGLVERAAAGNDGAALALFGALYDGEVTEEGLETEMGLTFSDDPATAASYYSRAVAAGSAEGATRLAAVCERLNEASDTLSRSAHQDYCQ